jgi:Flp pilus assembly protein TadG
MEFSGNSGLWARMQHSSRTVLRRLAAESRGAEIAEAAAVLPLMFMMLLGIFWFGQAFSIYGAITRAAQEGARAAAAPYCTTCSSPSTLSQNAINGIQTSMLASKLDPTKARNPASPPAFLSCSTGSAVSCPGSGNSNFCVQAAVQISGVTSGATGVCGVSVSFQYPFQFWLPFTALNKQQIWMTASARVRMETQ